MRKRNKAGKREKKQKYYPSVSLFTCFLFFFFNQTEKRKQKKGGAVL
jgi:hypothetical protein